MPFNLDRLSRVTASQRFIPEIDGLRFIAIATVVLFHLRTSLLRTSGAEEEALADDWFFQILSDGGLGVNIFFTISGFILALPFIKSINRGEQVNLRRYYLRRLTRLEPPYIIIMTGFFFLQLIFFADDVQDTVMHFLVSLLYLHFFVYGTWSTINPVAWSLETEVQFYVLAPWLAVIFKLKKKYVRYTLYAVIILAHTVVVFYSMPWLSAHHLLKSILFYFSNFFVGFILADLFETQDWHNARKMWIGDLLGTLGLFGCYVFYFDTTIYATLLFYLSVSLLFFGTFSGWTLNRILTIKVITVIGGMCYTIYLIHYVFLFALMPYLVNLLHMDSTTNFYLMFAACGTVMSALLLILSAAIFYYIEKPFMYPDWFKRFRGL